MRSPIRKDTAFCFGSRLLLLLTALLLPVRSVAAAAGCGQADAPALSDTARAILALNTNLSGGAGEDGVSARLAGAPRPAARQASGVLQSRARLVRELMQTHPEEVRAVALPAELAARLVEANPADAALIEHEASLMGEIRALAVDNFAEGTPQEAYVLHVPSTAGQVAIYTAASLRVQGLLRRPVAVTGVQLGSDLLAEAIAPGLSSAGSNAMSRVGPRAAAVPSTNTTLTCSTTGQQRTAVLMLQFPGNTPAFPGSYGTAAWWQQAIAGQGNSVNALWSEMTGGATYASVDVYGPLTLPQSYGCADYLAMRSAALALAANTIDMSKYTRIVLGFPASSCSFGGLADIGCNGADTIVPHPYSVVWMPIVTRYTASTGVWASLAHELGHNLGLNHANTLDFGAISLGPIDFQETNPGTVFGGGATSVSGAVTAVDTEYGDVFSAMGNPWSAGPGPYSAEHRSALLGWVPASGTGNGLGTITAAGSYTVQPSSGATGLRALRILRDPASASWIWLEYRNGSAPFDAANLATVTGQNISQGAFVHYENGYGDHEKTFALDMTPTGKGNNFANGALQPGTNWSDPYSPLSLTVNSITAAGLNVSVSYDSTCAAFSLGDSPVGASGGSGTVTVTAPATCSWRAGSNAAWMTLSGTASGVASGTGNGSFQWTAAANSGSGQRVTYLTVGRVSQRLLQTGAGANVLSVSPANATVAPGSNVTLSLTLQDAGGVADLQTVELDARVAGAPTCIVLAQFTSGVPTFYLLDPASEQYTTGVAAGSGSVTTAACTLQGSGNGVSSSGSTISVALNLSFPASVPGVRALYATVNTGTELPVGILNVGMVTAPQTNPPTNPVLQATKTTLAGLPTSTTPGAALSLSATVLASSGGVPTGTVTFLDGATSLGVVVLNSGGTANLSAPGLSSGTHVLTVVYSGDANFAASTSAAATVIVGQIATTTMLSTSAAQVTAGGNAVLTVTVAHTSGAIAPTGTVTLRDGSMLLTTAPLSNGTASIPLNGLSPGTHTLTATYSGDGSYVASISNAVVVTAGKLSPTMSVTAAPTVLAGSAVRVTVAVSGGATAGALTPTGTVLLQDGGVSLGSVTLTNGTGSLALNSLPTGPHTIVASYSGDSSFAAAGPGSTTVNVVDFSIAGPGTPADIKVTAGALTANTATVTLTPGSNGFPLSVTLACSGAPAGATCTVAPAAVTPGSAPVPVTVTVTTTANVSKLRVAAAAMFGLPLFGLAALARFRRFCWFSLAVGLVSLWVTTVLSGCGAGVTVPAAATTSTTGSTPSSGSGGTPTGTSTLTIQATAASGGTTLTRNAVVTLQVN